jgi:hypothetical protein
VAAAVALLVRNYSNPSDAYSFTSPKSLDDACEELLQAFEDSRLPHDPADHINDDDVHVPIDDEELLVPAPTNPDLPISVDTTTRGAITSLKPPAWCPIIQGKLRKLLIAIYTHLPGSEGSGQFFNVIMRCMLLLSIRESGVWLSSGNISQKAAAYLFAGRLIMSSIIDELREESGQYTHHECVLYKFFFSNPHLRF